MMRKLVILLAALVPLALTACDRVPAGNVGVKVYLLGSDKGVDHEVLSPGRYWIGVNEDLFLFPTFAQNYVWTKDQAEGSQTDESLSFQTVEGLTVSADVGVTYAIDPDKVPAIFQKYRKGVKEITNVYLRNMVRDAMVSEASNLPIESVYGRGKADLIAAVEKRVRGQVESIGIMIERIYWIGSLRLPQAVVAALDAKIAATQKAQQRENEVAQAKAEAEIKIEEARGQAESRRLNAEAEAKAIRLKGEALARFPQVLQLSALERWDGVLPRVAGETVPFIDVTPESQR